MEHQDQPIKGGSEFDDAVTFEADGLIDEKIAVEMDHFVDLFRVDHDPVAGRRHQVFRCYQLPLAALNTVTPFTTIRPSRNSSTS